MPVPTSNYVTGRNFDTKHPHPPPNRPSSDGEYLPIKGLFFFGDRFRNEKKTSSSSCFLLPPHRGDQQKRDKLPSPEMIHTLGNMRIKRRKIGWATESNEKEDEKSAGIEKRLKTLQWFIIKKFFHGPGKQDEGEVVRVNGGGGGRKFKNEKKRITSVAQKL